MQQSLLDMLWLRWQPVAMQSCRLRGQEYGELWLPRTASLIAYTSKHIDGVVLETNIRQHSMKRTAPHMRSCSAAAALAYNSVVYSGTRQICCVAPMQFERWAYPRMLHAADVSEHVLVCATEFDRVLQCAAVQQNTRNLQC